MRLVVTDMNLGLWAAAYVKEKINSFRPTSDKPFVLGLPTGGTMVDFYANLRLFYKEGLLDFKHVVTFNMDEYAGLPADHPQSYCSYMQRHLFQEVNIPRQNIHLLNSQSSNYTEECNRYEQVIRSYGGIDLFVGGVGRNGHIAFNEPGSSLESRTRKVELTASTRQANARFFLNDMNRVPTHALTVGIGTIFEAKELLFLAAGAKKAAAVAHFSRPGISAECPLTILKKHPYATLLVDPSAFSLVEGTPKKVLEQMTQTAPDAAHWALELKEEQL